MKKMTLMFAVPLALMLFAAAPAHAAPWMRRITGEKQSAKPVEIAPSTTSDKAFFTSEVLSNRCGAGYREVIEGRETEGPVTGPLNDAAFQCRQFVAGTNAGVMTRKGITYLGGESRVCRSVKAQMPADAYCYGRDVHPQPWLPTAYLCKLDNGSSKFVATILPWFINEGPVNLSNPTFPPLCSSGFTPRGNNVGGVDHYICQSDADEFQDYVEDSPGNICGDPNMEIAYVQQSPDGGLLHCCGTVVPSPIQ